VLLVLWALELCREEDMLSGCSWVLCDAVQYEMCCEALRCVALRRVYMDVDSAVCRGIYCARDEIGIVTIVQ
jgi:hypothetical protein